MVTEAQHVSNHAPTPSDVSAGKDAWDRGERLEPGTPRPFFCRSCGQRTVGTHVPRGWYSLTRHAGSRPEPPIRLGLYCSVDCLSAQMPRLIGVDKDIGENLETIGHRQISTEHPG